MQKWCPEAFSTGVSDETPDSGTVFRSVEGPAAAPGNGVDGQPFSFQRETGYTDPRSLLATLTREERADLYDLAETDVAGTYEARQKQQEDEYASRLAEARREAADSLAAWTRDIEAAVRADLSEAAAGAARLAIHIAEKLVRGTVAVDHGMLARSLETILYKQQTASPLRVSASPRDARWLADQTDLRTRLNIEVVADDRRLADGDCRVRSDGREWDLTVGGQLEVLAEIIEEAIATRRGTLVPEPEAGPR